jgi:hypothetical protein
LFGGRIDVPVGRTQAQLSNGVRALSGKAGPRLFYKRSILAGHWWLMSVILGTQEAEIRRISV